MHIYTSRKELGVCWALVKSLSESKDEMHTRSQSLSRHGGSESPSYFWSWCCGTYAIMDVLMQILELNNVVLVYIYIGVSS